MAGASTLEFNEGNFQEEVLNADVPVVVDFWAEWCMPCRMLAPTIDALASDYAGKAKVGKVDTDANQQIAVTYGIQSIPTVLIFKGGQVVETIAGGMTKKDQFAAAIDKHL